MSLAAGADALPPSPKSAGRYFLDNLWGVTQELSAGFRRALRAAQILAPRGYVFDEGWIGERGRRAIGERESAYGSGRRDWAPRRGMRRQRPKPSSGVRRCPPQSHRLLGVILWVSLWSRIDNNCFTRSYATRVAEEAGFELAPPRERVARFSQRRGDRRSIRVVSKDAVPFHGGDRRFESPSLRRRVCERGPRWPVPQSPAPSTGGSSVRGSLSG
jgi:hypothetical protein